MPTIKTPPLRAPKRGRGRPMIGKEPAVQRSIRLSDPDYATFNALGGVDWLRGVLSGARAAAKASAAG
jgi:hypothetical protein